MTYEEAVSWIHNRLKFGIKPGLERMNWMLQQLDNPERRITCVHLAGTNGKGSTLTYIRSILEQAEYKVGTFTSPYIESFNERISINGTPIPNEDIAELVRIVKPIAEALDETEFGAATEFEILTVMAFYYFGKINPCDIVLLETGLGGRLDSTNVIYPVLSIITTIGYDHMHVLGETLEEITSEKAGIIKSGVPVITGVSQQEALAVIAEEAQKRRAKVYTLGKEFSAGHTQPTADGETFTFESLFGIMENLSITMKGTHQVQNAALALMAVYYLKTYQSFLVKDEDIHHGLKKAFWLGRFEQLSDHPRIVIDGAHNPEGITSLVQTVQSHYADKRITVLFSALGDKKIAEMVAGLETIADHMVFTTFDFPRAISPELLAKHCSMEQKEIYQDWKEAIDKIKPILTEEDLFLITGSLYFISGVRKYITESR
ncbi:bifunctional folylpolyglutamate synthase/dihydrofolate synthase [Ectobacillus funiculus]|uniref:bifunctional folylpolyglutamate synthase/dihydrofolate synthase n=1 Tax=Ectobacillus funiculus TaxID=137993 RepID=UPI00397C4AA0